MKLQAITEAHFAFTANVARARAFLSIFDRPGGSPRTRGRPTDNEKELLRATVVFAVAALDAYLHDLVLEEVTSGNGHGPALADALRTISKEDPSLALRVALADTKSARRQEFRAALDAWLSTKSFQGPDAVVRALSYVGRPRSATELAALINDTWARDLAGWTEMRHRLVHRAQHPYVRRADAGRCVELIERIVKAIDEIVAGPPIDIELGIGP